MVCFICRFIRTEDENLQEVQKGLVSFGWEKEELKVFPEIPYSAKMGIFGKKICQNCLKGVHNDLCKYYFRPETS